MLWESTTQAGKGASRAREITQGVRLTPLSQILNEYVGRVAIRKLLEVEIDASMGDTLRRLRAQLKGRPYERSLLELARAAWDGPGGKNRADLSSLFCSELLAEAYQRVGLLALDPPANEYTPHDFSTQARRPLPLRRGRLSEEIFLTRRGSL